MTRLVIDASIWLSASIGPDDSPPVRLFEALMDSSFEAVACPLVLDEVRRGLAKPYFRDRLPAENADRLMRALTRASVPNAKLTIVTAAHDQDTGPSAHPPHRRSIYQAGLDAYPGRGLPVRRGAGAGVDQTDCRHGPVVARDRCQSSRSMARSMARSMSSW